MLSDCLEHWTETDCVWATISDQQSTYLQHLQEIFLHSTNADQFTYALVNVLAPTPTRTATETNYTVTHSYTHEDLLSDSHFLADL